PDLRDAQRVDGELVRRRPFGAEGAPVDRALRVALDVDDAAVADAHELAAADRTVGADARHLARVGDPQLSGFHLRGPQVEAEVAQPAQAKPAARRGPEETAPAHPRRKFSHGPALHFARTEPGYDL